MKTLFTHNPKADRVCKKSKLGSVLFVILSILLLCLSLTACGGIAGKTDLAPYLSVRYSGYNGNGTAHVDFDFADFEYSIMSGWKGGNNLEKLSELTAVEMTITYKADVSEGLRNGLHLGRYCCVISGKISMISSCIDYAKCVACGSKIEINRVVLRVFLILKIDRHYAAQCASHLIKKTGWFSEIYVFRILPDFCDLGQRYAV
jgi:hypothetical protein